MTEMTDTYLSPIETPQGLIKRLAYHFTRKQFGRVPTPIKVHLARLPAAFGLFYTKISKLDRKLTLPRELIFLIREQVARINVCEFCVDIGHWFTIQESMNQAKFDALEHYRTSPLFSEAERAALDYGPRLRKRRRSGLRSSRACPVISRSRRSARSSGSPPASTSTTSRTSA